MLSVASVTPWGNEKHVGCFIKGSKMSLLVNSSVFDVPVVAQDDLPLLSCHVMCCERFILAVAGGLCTTELLVAVLRAPQSVSEVSGGSKKRRQESHSEWWLDDGMLGRRVKGVRLAMRDAGAFNSLCCFGGEKNSEGGMEQVRVVMGRADGSVQTLTLTFASSSNDDDEASFSLRVGSERLLWSHSQDVRGVSCCREECNNDDDGNDDDRDSSHWVIASCGDDGEVKCGRWDASDKHCTWRSSDATECLCVALWRNNSANKKNSEFQIVWGTRGRRVERSIWRLGQLEGSSSLSSLIVPTVPKTLGRSEGEEEDAVLVQGKSMSVHVNFGKKAWVEVQDSLDKSKCFQMMNWEHTIKF